MEFEQKIVEVNVNKIRYIMMEKISTILLENNGMIFGGYVRDKLIHNHYDGKFRGLDCDRFSDPSYSPETKWRLLVANDIDVFIRGDEEDVQKLYYEFENKGYKVIEKISKQKYFDDVANIEHFKIELALNGANRFGLDVKIPIDILFSEEKGIEPPFGRLDMLCNGLVLDKTGVRLSTQTGCPMDRLNHFDRKFEEIEIVKKILRLESDTVRMTQDLSTQKRSIRINRILNMQFRGWTINNNVFCAVDDDRHDRYTTKSLANKHKITEFCASCADTSKPRLKLKCCGARVHLCCLHRMVEDNCLICDVCKIHLNFL